MEEIQRKERIQVGEGKYVEIEWREYKLELRAEFGTSHSRTRERRNGLIGVKVGDACGWGEVGLPPKKPFCYLADFDDLHTFLEHWTLLLRSLGSSLALAPSSSPFALFDSRFFPFAPRSSSDDSSHDTSLWPVPIFHNLLLSLDTPSLRAHDAFHTALSGIEMAIFDAWSR